MNERVCPWWMGYFLASPIRKLGQDPKKILGPYLKEGDTALDVGSAMGYFSLPMARLVGKNGRVVCVDLQEKMIAGLRRRAARAGIAGRMELRVCSPTSLQIGDLAGKIDFALAFAVVHEVPDARNLFSEILAAMKESGTFLLSEPTVHVMREVFEKTVSVAQAAGFRLAATPNIRRSHSVLLTKG